MIFPSGLLSLGDVYWIFGLTEKIYIYRENIFQFFFEENRISF
jgi:hypothetical protein